MPVVDKRVCFSFQERTYHPVFWPRMYGGVASSARKASLRRWEMGDRASSPVVL